MAEEHMSRTLHDMIADTLKEIETAMERATWRLMPLPLDCPDTTAVAYAGTGDGWAILVMEFAHTDGSRGFDGSAVKHPTAMRVPRDLAAKGVALARKALQGPRVS